MECNARRKTAYINGSACVDDREKEIRKVCVCDIGQIWNNNIFTEKLNSINRAQTVSGQNSVKLDYETS